ncbi:hypothetical protein D1872_333730 [compost metagenome]
MEVQSSNGMLDRRSVFSALRFPRGLRSRSETLARVSCLKVPASRKRRSASEKEALPITSFAKEGMSRRGSKLVILLA